jgi:DNA helicase-2/ATP-dependent DNA helicase PcrA
MLTPELNNQQRKAVVHNEGPLLLLAGAGSGKTKTLTHRIAYLIAEKNVDSSRILAVTFTNKAAKEMRVRLAKLLSKNADDKTFMPWMGTFHSICVKILRFDGENIGVPKNFIILDESDKLSLVKQAMKSLGVNEKNISARSISSQISSAKNDLVAPDEYQTLAYLPAQKITGDVYFKYEKIKRDSNSLDFDDLILETVNLLKNTILREKWSKRFQHILIDEYQDTNKAQYRLIKLLVNDNQNICVVGDDWQSIYSFRGADFTNILNFERDFPGAEIIKLEENYRSTGAILDAAHKIITKNKQRSDKILRTNSGSGMPVEVVNVNSEAEEANFLLTKIMNSVNINARNYQDYAVLYRTNAQSRAIEDACIRYNVPYRIVGGTRFYDRKEIKDVLAYLRLVYQPNDRASLLRVINIPARGLGDKSIANFLNWQESSGLDILEAMRAASTCPSLTPKAKKSLSDFGSILTQIRNNSGLLENSSEYSSLYKIIDDVIKKSKYLEYLDDKTVGSEDRQLNVKELLTDAEQRPDTSLVEYLEEVALVTSQDNVKDDNAITLMTLHAAKGLEFPVVFMVGMEETIFPHTRALYEQSEMEEERRLCYVGMTRAREELYLISASTRALFGSRQYNLPSRFLGDIEEE